MTNPNTYDPTQKPNLHTGIDDTDLLHIQLALDDEEDDDEEDEEDEADEEDLDVDEEDEEIEDEDDHLIHVNGSGNRH
jgi:hypothetical protein